MDIGSKLKNLRLKKGLTQEELAERTDLSKGYISQIEHESSSPSMETFFDILEVLGVTPQSFFDAKAQEQKIVYDVTEHTHYEDTEKGYRLQWLVPESNEKEMEPVIVTFSNDGSYKQFEPSLSETFGYCLAGEVVLEFGKQTHVIKQGEALYYQASEPHRIYNGSKAESTIILVATESYL
ncbi:MULTISPECIES: helix-turn-helix domain-containing protein [Brochothrix]|uniref:Putative transcriptional regulatorCro/CI family n=1 Tax=Brochothrix thermosphacta TaxID=2756 RepID=A0A1D2LEF7_BROTH|nr:MULTISPECIES: XRE family transcriptional regulator [Brochothrix]SLM90250.1 Transcriptional regulator, MerR family, near polyamine transporter [Brachybacterium faecium]ANZ94699.1 Cro/Cl family transcriptional regulator [Brochothrix thermosphacta]ANZ96989.1 Cro/Cl family transcriptional regulator [Brochothrix thermosphacta]ATF26416.1 XRE family transcriptional regulator [Brochothrix thermosphacta]ATH85756.1 XRE family transcriptional regulator [Brochothrix thermosphacta]